MAEQFTATVHNHTDQDVRISQPGTFRTSRQVVKPKTVETLSFKVGFVRRYIKGNRPPDVIKVEVKAGRSKPGERVRVRCSNKEFDIVQTSHYTIETVHQVKYNGEHGFEIAIHYVEEFSLCTSSLTYPLRGFFHDEYPISSSLSRSSFSSDVNFERMSDRDWEWIATSGSSVSSSCYSSRECDESATPFEVQDRVLRAPIGRTHLGTTLQPSFTPKLPWLLHPPSPRQIRNGRWMTPENSPHRFRKLVPSAPLRSSCQESDDNFVRETDAATSLVDTLNRWTQSLPSDTTFCSNLRLASSGCSSASSSCDTPGSSVPSRLHLARVRRSRQSCSGSSDKILHRDELLRRINSGMNSSNPFMMTSP